MITSGGTATLGLYDLKRKIDAFGGVDYFRPNLAGGYLKNARVMLANGDIVKSTADGNVNDPNVDMTSWEFDNSPNSIVTVNSVAEMLSLRVFDGLTVKTKSYNTPNYDLKNPLVGGMTYIYVSSRSSENDGGSVINGWVAQFPEYNAVNVDWFGADPNGVLDSSNAVGLATRYLTGNTNSVVLNNEGSGTVNFSIGTYILSDVIVGSGVTYAGAGEYSTNIIPALEDKDCFVTLGTSSVVPFGGTYTRCDGFTFKDMYFGNLFAFTSNVRTIPARSGAFNFEFCSRYTLSNITVNALSGCALRVVETWDCDINSFKAIGCGGYEADGTTVIPAVFIGRGAEDTSNAMRIRYMRLENNLRSLHISAGTRHCVFSDIKIEGGELSNIIEGAFGIVFNSPELTWQKSEVPMFKIKLYQAGEFPSHDSSGVTFIAPQCISSSYGGWYFDCDDAGGQVDIIAPFMRTIKTLVSGAKFSIIGGNGYDVGSDLVKMTGNNCKMIGVTLSAIISGTATDGSSDTVQISGANCQVESNTFISKSGSNTDGKAFINVANASSKVRNNAFGGPKQWGIRATSMSTSGGNVRDNYIIGSAVGSLLSSSSLFPEYSLTSRSSFGLGVGTIESNPNNVIIPSGGSAVVNILHHGSQVLMTFDYSKIAILLGDVSIPALTLVSATDPTIKIGSGAAGDGNVYLSKSGASGIQITNNTASSISVRTSTYSVVKTP